MNEIKENKERTLENLLAKRQEWEDYIPINQAAYFLKEEKIHYINQEIQSLTQTDTKS